MNEPMNPTDFYNALRHIFRNLPAADNVSKLVLTVVPDAFPSIRIEQYAEITEERSVQQFTIYPEEPKDVS